MLIAAVLLTWIAAGYRVGLTLSQPRRLWRSSFTVVMVSVAVSLTSYAFRDQIDQYLRVPGLAGLASRTAITIGVGFLLVYIHALRVEAVPRLALVVYSVITVGVLTTLVASWLIGSFRQRAQDDLLADPSMAVALYCLSFWSFLAIALALTARTCLRRWRTVRHQDPAREVSLLLTASGTLVGLTALITWSSSLVLTMSGLDGWVINGIGDQLLPVAAVLVAAGVICLLVVPYVGSLLVAWRRWYTLRPLWTELVSRYPQVHLELRARGGPLTRLQFRSERMIIETLDALRIAPVGEPSPETTGVEAVALFLAKGPAAEGGVYAAELLDHSESRDADVDQLVALAGAFERLHRVAA